MPAHKFAFTGILREPAQTSVKLKLQLVQLESSAWMLLAVGETWLPLDLFHRHQSSGTVTSASGIASERVLKEIRRAVKICI
jgi:hypothetical protein